MTFSTTNPKGIDIGMRVRHRVTGEERTVKELRNAKDIITREAQFAKSVLVHADETVPESESGLYGWFISALDFVDPKVEEIAALRLLLARFANDWVAYIGYCKEEENISFTEFFDRYMDGDALADSCEAAYELLKVKE